MFITFDLIEQSELEVDSNMLQVSEIVFRLKYTIHLYIALVPLTFNSILASLREYDTENHTEKPVQR